jgi:uncharacterized membrane protein
MLLPALGIGLAVFMVLAGAMHFRSPRAYERIMPAWLPAHRPLVVVSGAFEVLGGLGLLVPATRSLAAWGLVALFVAVFPANVNMAVHRLPLGKRPLPTWALWARLPLQLVFIAWAWALT